MNALTLHPWDMTPDEAVDQQSALRDRVILEDGFSDLRTVAGVDLSYDADRNEGYAVVVLLSWPDLQVREAYYATGTPLMPYIPGLLSFRETPIALQAFAQIATPPDLIFVDGAGIAHPRAFGIACHLGVLLDVPAIGVAKSFLYGSYTKSDLPDEEGAALTLLDRAKKRPIGTVLRNKPRTNPLFVSPGHRVSLDSAPRLVREATRGYRLPEPTRQAHNLITEYKKTGRGPIPPPAEPTLPL